MAIKHIKMDNIIEVDKPTKIDRNKFTLYNFHNLFDTFLNRKSIEGIANRTLKDYKMCKKFLDNYFYDVLGLSKSNSLKTNYFHEYVAYMKLQKQYANNTINIRLRYIKAYLNWLYEEEYLKENISKKIKLVKTPKDTIKPLNTNDVRKILKEIDTTNYSGFRNYVFILLCLDTGIRIQEAISLEVEDINIRNAVITVKADNAKTRETRFLPVSNKVIRLLKQLIQVSNKYNSPWIFLSERDGTQLTYNAISSAFNNLVKKAKINKKCTLYMLRHTFATNAIKADMDIFTLQRIMGHTELSTTRKYIQLDTKHLIKKKNQIDTLKDYF